VCEGSDVGCECVVERCLVSRRVAHSCDHTSMHQQPSRVKIHMEDNSTVFFGASNSDDATLSTELRLHILW